MTVKKAFSASIFLKIPKNFSAVEKKLKKVYYRSCDKEVVDFFAGFLSPEQNLRPFFFSGKGGGQLNVCHYSPNIFQLAFLGVKQCTQNQKFWTM